MKSIKKFFLPLAMITLILLAFPGAAGQVEKAAGSKNTLAPSGAGTLNKEAVMARAAYLAVPFVQNAGRFDKEVLYSADLFSGRFFLTGKELVYSLAQRSKKSNSRSEKGISFKEYFLNEKGSWIAFQPAGEEKGTPTISYFRGNDPAKWRSGMASYNSVSLGDVYPGIQVKLRASGKNVEKMFYVSPRGDVARIRIHVAGVAGLKIAKDGRLLFENSLGELAMRAPVAWQEINGRRHEVKVSYRLSGKKTYGFEIIGNYAKDRSITIDPDLDSLLAATFFGGREVDQGKSLALDKIGNIYVAGRTDSLDFPTTYGAFDRSYNGGDYSFDAIIFKMNGGLNTLKAATYLGGSRDDDSSSLALDSAGNVFLTGGTVSPDFPVTHSAYRRNFNNYVDYFICKLDGNLKTLLASTYLDSPSGNPLALDSSGNVYLSGWREGATVFKLDGGLTTLLASFTFKNPKGDHITSLALDSKGNVFLGGYTLSRDFPITPGAYDPTFNGSRDNFIAKLDGNLTTLLASTFLGGNSMEEGVYLALDTADNVYLTAYTHSKDFPTTIDAYDQTFGDNDHFDAFVSKLDNRLTTLLASTFLGGSEHDGGRSLAVDSDGNVYVTGTTGSTDFPTTPGAYDRTYNGYNEDVFVSKLDSRLKNLLSSTFLGGSGSDSCSSLILDRAGNIYLTGLTQSPNFPTTPGAYDRTLAHNFEDVFVARLNGGMNVFKVTSPDGGQNWLAGTPHDIDWTHSGSIANVRIEISTDNGSSWSDIAVSPARYHTFPWTVPNTPSSRCLVRISDIGHAATSDTSDAVFTILMNIDLQVERREIKAFSIVRQYGRIQFLVPTFSNLVTQYLVLRRQGTDDFTVLKTVAPSELRDNQSQMQDKFLEEDKTYTYRIEAYNGAGELIGRSAEKKI